jgi:threonine dehydrogenase-like Zn-dependent dehydrogenase
MGLGAVRVGSFLGAEIIAVEPNPYRRKLALKLGAVAALDPGEGNIVDQVLESTKGYGLDQALECSGASAALHAALDLVRPFGHVAIVGENSQATMRPSDHFLRKEIVMSGATCFPLAEFPSIVRAYE